MLGNALLDVALNLSETPYKGSPYARFAGVRKLTLRPRLNAHSNRRILIVPEPGTRRGRRGDQDGQAMDGREQR
jgi:hypothetical protein